MLEKRLSDLGIEDLERLIRDGVSEGKTLEYKQALPADADSDKKGFLADVSSFANTVGGFLIYGMTEEKGMPKALVAINMVDQDTEIRRLDNLIRDGIAPRIKSQIKILSHESGGILVIQVERSWTSPHRVTFKGHDKFYARNSAGKYPLDVGELKSAFLLSQTLSEKVKRFHEERIAAVETEKAFHPLIAEAKTVLHIIPLNSFDQGQQIDLQKVIDTPGKLRPLDCRGWDHRINLEGFLAYSGSRDESGRAYAYAQLFRNGIIEAVNCSILGHTRHATQDGKTYVPTLTFEDELIKSTNEYLALLHELGAQPPFVMFISILGAEGRHLGVSSNMGSWIHEYPPIDRHIIDLPEIIVDDYGMDAAKILRPSFNLFWNVCGYPRSHNYDEDGNRKPSR